MLGSSPFYYRRQEYLLWRKYYDNRKKTTLKFDMKNYFAVDMIPLVEELEDGHKFAIYSTGYEAESSTFAFDGFDGICPSYERTPAFKLYRTVIDLKKSEQSIISHKPVIEHDVVEVPRQDPVNSNIVYGSISNQRNESSSRVGLCKIDTRTSTAEYWWAERHCFTQEPIPVAKGNGDDGSWILCLVNACNKERTTLVILDSDKFEDGPVARIHLPHRVTHMNHGWFAPKP